MLLVLLSSAHACIWVGSPPSTSRYRQVYSEDESWLAEVDREDGTLRVYRTVDPFHPAWATSIREVSGGSLRILDTGTVIVVRERVSRADEVAVVVARATGTQKWSVADLGGEVVEVPIGVTHSCSGYVERWRWLERSWIEGGQLVVDPVTGPPRHLALGD